MKGILGVAALAAVMASTAYATDVGVSIGFSEPGVYGRIDIGRYPQPAVIVPQPVLIAPPPPTFVVQPQPIYVWVPFEHRKHWDKECRKYNACAVPVYFVRHDWYNQHVRYVDDPHGHGGHGPGKWKGKHKH